MFTSFEGQTRSRPVINLGGVAASSSSTSSSSATGHIADRARQDRLRREELRRLDHHARRIQAFYRGTRQVAACRQAVRNDLDTLMVQLDGAIASSSSTSYKDPAVALLLLEVTVRLLFVFRPSNKTDVLRLAKLARHYASGKPVIGVFQATEGIARLDTRDPAADYFKRWIHLLVRMAQLMLWQIAVNPT